MGKSDSIIFPWYVQRMSSVRGKRIAFLGQTGHNALSIALQPSQASFYDITLGNWDINQQDEWNLPEVDAVVCTRCAYFSDDPEQFINRCIQTVAPGGSVFIDWGLGDHWRHSHFMVGWERGDQRVSADYLGTKYLRSTYWMREFEDHPNVGQFRDLISNKGYTGDLTQIVRDEVPRIACSPFPIRYDAVALWPDSPQLYILTEFARD